MSSVASLKRAANNVVTQSLVLQRNQNLLIFADAESQACAEVIAEAAYEIDSLATIFSVPRFFQSRFGINGKLPLPVEAGIREADAILISLSDRPEHWPCRRSILLAAWNRRTKVAHAPGLTVDHLRWADVDYQRIGQQSQDLALALIFGQQLEIISADSQGRQYRLAVETGGWDPCPMVSDGIIREGSWANLPPGETYIIPQNGAGQIAVNGSMPGWVLAPEEDLILTFQRGQLTDVQPQDSPAVRYLYETQIGYARSQQDNNWSNLAELGFGLNPAIRRLTGSALVDTKKAGTIHVALGHSAIMGGEVEAAIHCDLVVQDATVSVDGRLVLDEGQWRVDGLAWYPDHHSVLVPAGWWENVTSIHRRGAQTEQDNGYLARRWNSGPGRWDTILIGVEPTARLATKLYALLPARGEAITKERLLVKAAEIGLDEANVPALLWVMSQYDLIRFPGESKS